MLHDTAVSSQNETNLREAALDFVTQHSTQNTEDTSLTELEINQELDIILTT